MSVTVSNITLTKWAASNQVQVTWTFSESNVSSYWIFWDYTRIEDKSTYIAGTAYEGTDTGDPMHKAYVIDIPQNAYKMRVSIYPEPTSSAWWYGAWSGYKTIRVDSGEVEDPLPSPDVPEFEFTPGSRTVHIKLENLGEIRDTTRVRYVQFQIANANKETDYKLSDNIELKATTFWAATWDYTLKVGKSYRVRARFKDEDKTFNPPPLNGWGNWSDDFSCIPANPTGLSLSLSSGSTSSGTVKASWSSATGADSYTIQYALEKDYLGLPDLSTEVSDITTTYYYCTQLELGKTYFMRVKAVNDNGDSQWSSVESIVNGAKPNPPTTWSNVYSTTVTTSVNLYWSHNSVDGSPISISQVRYRKKGTDDWTTINVERASSSQYIGRYLFTLPSQWQANGVTIEWQARTKGILTSDDYWSGWSSSSAIDFYDAPSLNLTVKNSSGGQIDPDGELTEYPFTVELETDPSNVSTVIGYSLSVTPTTTYRELDDDGSTVRVQKNQPIYNEYFVTSENSYTVEFTPKDILLHQNVTYKIKAEVFKSSGLSKAKSQNIEVAFTSELEYDVSATITVDKSKAKATIKPMCRMLNEQTIATNMLLSIYRINYDGTLTSLVEDREYNSSSDDWGSVTDLHPSLKWAKYRIVAVDKNTGAITSQDIPAKEVGIPGIIIDWEDYPKSYIIGPDERKATASFADDVMRTYLKLPYNVDISSAQDHDYSHVAYAGRNHPVAYYGTLKNETATWTAEIPVDDNLITANQDEFDGVSQTMSLLKSLAEWSGPVYAREAVTGIGYYATAKVSFSHEHNSLTVPITIELTRIEQP